MPQRWPACIAMKLCARRSSSNLTGNTARYLHVDSLRRTMPKNMLNRAADAFWYSYTPRVTSLGGRIADEQYFDDYTPLDIRSLCNAAFAAGARWSMRETTRLNPYVSQFIEMLILLGAFDNAEMASAESAAASGTETTGTATGSQGEHDNDDMPAMSDAVFVSDAAAWHGA